MKYFVATGGPHWIVETEIVDVSDPARSCSLEDISHRLGSVGGLLETAPVICGGMGGGVGSGFRNDCLLYGTSKVITMNTKRFESSSVTINSTMIWVLGGLNSGNELDSSEFITEYGTKNGPSLPEAVRSSCAVKFIETGDVYLVGGRTSTEAAIKNVWLANPSNDFTFTQGPSLITSREAHGCGTMSIGAKSIIVAAGGMDSSIFPGYITSVEILDPPSKQWIAGILLTGAPNYGGSPAHQ